MDYTKYIINKIKGKKKKKEEERKNNKQHYNYYSCWRNICGYKGLIPFIERSAEWLLIHVARQVLLHSVDPPYPPLESVCPRSDVVPIATAPILGWSLPATYNGVCFSTSSANWTVACGYGYQGVS